MPVHLTRSAAAVALALSVGLVAVPACKKKPKPTAAAAPAPNPTPTPTPQPDANPNATAPDPAAPKGPIFSGQNPRVVAARTAATNNMKLILFALHSYHDQHGALPAGYADKSGKPG